MRWRLTLEEFSPELIYIKGSINIVADALSCRDEIDNLNSNKDNKVEATLESPSENCALSTQDVLHPTCFRKSVRTIPSNNFMGQVR